MSANKSIIDQGDPIPTPRLRLDENATKSDGMTRGEATREFLFGVILPTVDVGSDLLFAFQFLLVDKDNCYGVEKYAYATVSFTFPALSFLFVTFHWWQFEKPGNRLKTLPFLLLQVWPQARVMRMIYQGYIKKDPQWRKDQILIQENIICITLLHPC